jgi:hypothetical protein
MCILFSRYIFCIKQGCQLFRQAGHTERYNVLRGPDHLNISTVTNTKLNLTIKIAQTYLINVKLGPAFASQEN